MQKVGAMTGLQLGSVTNTTLKSAKSHCCPTVIRCKIKSKSVLTDDGHRLDLLGNLGASFQDEVPWTSMRSWPGMERANHHVDDVSVCPDMFGSSDLPRLVRFAERRKTFNASVQSFSSCLSSKQAPASSGLIRGGSKAYSQTPCTYKSGLNNTRWLSKKMVWNEKLPTS